MIFETQTNDAVLYLIVERCTGPLSAASVGMILRSDNLLPDSYVD